MSSNEVYDLLLSFFPLFLPCLYDNEEKWRLLKRGNFLWFYSCLKNLHIRTNFDGLSGKSALEGIIEVVCKRCLDLLELHTFSVWTEPFSNTGQPVLASFLILLSQRRYKDHSCYHVLWESGSDKIRPSDSKDRHQHLCRCVKLKGHWWSIWVSTVPPPFSYHNMIFIDVACTLSSSPSFSHTQWYTLTEEAVWESVLWLPPVRISRVGELNLNC